MVREGKKCDSTYRAPQNAFPSNFRDQARIRPVRDRATAERRNPSRSAALDSRTGFAICTGLPLAITLTFAPLTTLSFPVIRLSTTANFHSPLFLFSSKTVTMSQT